MKSSHLRCFWSWPLGHRWEHVHEDRYDFRRCRECGKSRPLDEMVDRAPPALRASAEAGPLLVALILGCLALVAGVLLAVTTGGLLGPILIVGGVGALGVVALPSVIESFAQFLSTGSWRRR